jgi:hypothetical protein
MPIVGRDVNRSDEQTPGDFLMQKIPKKNMKKP